MFTTTEPKRFYSDVINKICGGDSGALINGITEVSNIWPEILTASLYVLEVLHVNDQAGGCKLRILSHETSSMKLSTKIQDPMVLYRR